MILLDTHVWVWWVHADPQMPAPIHAFIQTNESGGLSVSAISVWEVAKLVSLRRIILPCPIDQWFHSALVGPGIQVLPLTPEIAVESTNLPGAFHRDPADQIIVATARIQGLPLVTMDRLIRNYPHVTMAP